MMESGRNGVALLVGAGDAIGAAMARRFAAGGYSVCIARRSAEKSQSLVQDIISSGGSAHAVGTDVRSEKPSRRSSHKSKQSWDPSKFACSMLAPTSNRR